GSFENQLRDFVRMRDQCEMAGPYLDRLGAHALGHKPLEVGIDCAVLGRSPRWLSCARNCDDPLGPPAPEKDNSSSARDDFAVATAGPASRARPVWSPKGRAE